MINWMKIDYHNGKFSNLLTMFCGLPFWSLINIDTARHTTGLSYQNLVQSMKFLSLIFYNIDPGPIGAHQVKVSFSSCCCRSWGLEARDLSTFGKISEEGEEVLVLVHVMEDTCVCSTWSLSLAVWARKELTRPTSPRKPVREIVCKFES